MSTRGAIGFYYNGDTKAFYNHFDSYPECLGISVLNQVRRMNLNDMRERFKSIVMVDEDSMPKPELMTRYADVADLGVSSHSLSDWYCLLRNVQGRLDLYMDGTIEHMIDAVDFLTDSLYCEWAYIVNLDDGTLEVYKGFNRDKGAQGRYRKGKADRYGYYGVSLLTTFPLDNLPSESEFLSKVSALVGDD